VEPTVSSQPLRCMLQLGRYEPRRRRERFEVRVPESAPDRRQRIKSRPTQRPAKCTSGKASHASGASGALRERGIARAGRCASGGRRAGCKVGAGRGVRSVARALLSPSTPCTKYQPLDRADHPRRLTPSSFVQLPSTIAGGLPNIYLALAPMASPYPIPSHRHITQNRLLPSLHVIS